MLLVLGALLAALVTIALPASSAAPAPAAIPLASCFWEGPISTQRPTTRGFDGRNFNFPEESATYWLARFNLPAGARLTLAGRYPHARYMSLNSYSEGAPTDALSDIRIRPRRGSTNPFGAGARRDLRRRGWLVRVFDQQPPQGDAARQPNTLYAQPAGDAPIELLYRVYEPDRGLGLSGGTALPRPFLALADGRRLRRKAACAAINDSDRQIPVQTIEPQLWGLRHTPPCAPTNPAYDPVRWERFFNIEYAQEAVLTDCTPPGREARLAMGATLKGGLYSNRDSAYVYTHLSRSFGPLLVVRGTLPRTPQTHKGPRRMPGGQVRFWSLCSGESRVTVRTPDCLSDAQVLARSGRRYTIVVSRRGDRPRNAISRCGVAWLDWGERGDGVGDRDYGLLIMRNMLASPSFARAIQKVQQPGQEEATMGRHFPRSEYSTRSGFEALGCPAA